MIQKSPFRTVVQLPMVVSLRARILLAAIATILFIPVAGIPLQDKESLEQFHLHSLARWPSFDFLPDPARYFVEAKKWVADRAYPIAEASTLQNTFLLYALRTPPYRRVTLGRDGFIFLNSSDDEHLYGIFESECNYDRTPERFDDFRKSLDLMAAFARERGISLDVVIIPTLTTLYGDYLPSSVPDKYRIACAEHAAGRTPLLHIDAPAPVHFVYPFLAMRAARDDEAFFPKGNFHPTGLSLKVARDAYLVSLGKSGRRYDTLDRDLAPSEVLLFHGRIYKYLPVYKLHDPYVRFDNDTNAAIRRVLSPLFEARLVETQAYTNSRPEFEQTALLVSDSFGTIASVVFAGAFRRLLHAGTNDIGEADTRLVELIGRLQAVAPIDRLIFLVNDGNLNAIRNYGQILGRASLASHD